MILIADSGSTRTTWCLAGEPPIFFETEGYNPYFVDRNYIIESLHRSFPPTINPNLIKEIYFYSAGSADTAPVLKDVLNIIFPGAETHIEDDTLGAARALLGNNPGFAAILGTGTPDIRAIFFDTYYLSANDLIDHISDVATYHGMKPGRILSSPIEKLADFHRPASSP